MLAKWEKNLAEHRSLWKPIVILWEAIRIVPDVALTQGGTFAYK
jgi:hypothetical protein